VKDYGTELDGFGAGSEDEQCSRHLEPGRRSGGKLFLSVPERDPAFGQIVRREFESHFVAGEHANAIAAKAARKMGQHDAVMVQLHAEQTARKLLENGACYFYAVFLTHSTSLLKAPRERYAE